jgi:hypothetical protein
MSDNGLTPEQETALAAVLSARLRDDVPPEWWQRAAEGDLGEIAAFVANVVSQEVDKWV